MIKLVIGIASTLALSWVAFMLARCGQRWISRGHGARWMAMAALIGLCQWPINFVIGNPIISPIAVAVLYLLALIGLAPDDTVLTTEASALSRWFQRGLIAATAGTLGGMAIWAVLMWRDLAL